MPPESRHGGDRADHRRRFPQASEPLLDLSTGINPWPHGAGLAVADPGNVTRLPPPAALAETEALAAQAFELAPAAAIVATPGSGLALALLALLLRAPRTAIVGPTYSGLADAFHAAGTETLHRPTLEAAIATEAPVLALCRPNNPDGSIPDADEILRAARSRTVIVDEAFADLEPCGRDLAPRLSAEGPILLRSFGKTYGLPGLRLGLAAGPPAIIHRLRAALGAWPVSGHALAVARAALPDATWRERAARHTADAATMLDWCLAVHDLASFGGTRLFRLLRHPRAPGIADHLGRAGIMVRRFNHDSTLIRVGLPPDDGALARLDRAIASFPLETAADRE